VLVQFLMVFKWFPRLRPAGDPAYRTPGSTLRGLDRLPLRLD